MLGGGGLHRGPLKGGSGGTNSFPKRGTMGGKKDVNLKKKKKVCGAFFPWGKKDGGTRWEKKPASRQPTGRFSEKKPGWDLCQRRKERELDRNLLGKEKGHGRGPEPLQKRVFTLP